MESAVRPRELIEAGARRRRANALERDVLQQFLDRAAETLTRMDASLGARDVGRLEIDSHALKGSCRQLGAAPLGDVCESLEVMGRSGDLDRAAQTLAEAHREFARLRAVLRRHLDGRAA